MRFNQKGIIHILVLVILLAGLLAGVYLVQQTQIFKPRAQTISGPITTPAPICKSRISSFAVSNPCDEINNGFRVVTYSCQIDSGKVNTQVNKNEKCYSIADLSLIAEKACINLCFEPTISPTPIGRVCAQVITTACSPKDLSICKDFPTPCDVPEGWIVKPRMIF